ncbi:disease resistance RPP13-like protein 4 [Phoenix dactylifera]|uniref:Disease resistance RPP13-like protein 4 n=1 Tax=Phoenix dactylifera TaxID=42345 RepID=A0A8B7D5K3_PHODC|nr:disease resistance RPP13-like protein 4 [Phoenix dactylifera]XP_038973900.1 disease resistance RPP13-like protein 4 [Phoenix dactylifera]
MSKEGIIEEVLTPLVKQLGNARCQALKFKENDTPPAIKPLFESIEKNVQDVEDIVRRAERWEKDVINNFGIVARHVDDILEEDSEPRAFESKLRNVDREIANLRALLTPPLQLPQIESARAASTRSVPSLSKALQASEKWQQLELEKKILESSAISSLQVSYDNLDVQLKLCLLCFSVFPENSIIRKRPVIYWWIGEGLVTPTRDNTAEEIGESCFRKLIMKGLIEPVHMKRSPIIKFCKLHPWMRWMLIAVARRVQFFDFDSEGNPTSDDSLSRRACLVTRKEGAPQQMSIRGLSNLGELLTLFNVDEHYLNFERSRFSEMRKITVLQLGRWQSLPKHHIEVESTEFLKGLRSFKHLRYLSFQGISRITELPASISEISNLRILDLRACHNLERLTVGIASLQKLTHLDLSECHLLEQIPKGIASLSELEVLKGFVIGDARSKDASRLRELAKLKKLRKLSIIIGSKMTVTEEELNELRNCEAVRSLTITWVVSPSKKGTATLTRTATMTITSFSLPSNLEKLDLRCFPGKTVPAWLSPNGLRSLKKLYIRGGTLSSLGPEIRSPTWNVEVLRLKYLRDLEVEWSQIQSNFPNLTYLEIVKCSKLRSFPCDEDGVWVSVDREISGHSTSGSNGITIS